MHLGFELARRAARSKRRESGREIIGARLDRLRDRDKQVAVAIKDAAGAEHRQTDDLLCAGRIADDMALGRLDLVTERPETR
jgi:hypothetical protein